MPRYAKKTFRKKRNYKKKPQRRISMFSKSPSYPIGKTFKFKTRYVEFDGALHPTIGTADNFVYSMNSLFDPDTTGVGHQPLGFDQLMPLYDHYTVIGSRARVNFTNYSDSDSVIVTSFLKDNASTSQLTNDIIENGKCKYQILGPSDGGKNQSTMIINCNPTKFFGSKVMSDSKYSGTITTSPADQVYLHLHTRSTNTSATPGQVQYCIEIEYIAILNEPKQLIGS